ncbi:divalent-cation tolerance protein CutA [Pseudofulvimonas gallinarii]|jgi:periplasmic divalent cation tolerance protein|nr:divalent-cation tolerance protein CutA [Pseudofulvimonas gallinarii]THD13866.1 divalent-cation tolerance protein CutA [Pseudofulvimonas gallinarii]
METTPALLCLATCPDEACAASLARALVGEGLAACVSRLPMTASVYRWQGEVHEEPEVLLLIKTTRECWPRLKERLPALHPYDTPELIALPVSDGLPAYLAWLAAETLR